MVAMTRSDLSQRACREMMAGLSPFGPISVITRSCTSELAFAMAIVRAWQRERLAFSFRSVVPPLLQIVGVVGELQTEKKTLTVPALLQIVGALPKDQACAI